MDAPLPQLFMDPHGRLVDATGAPVQLPPGLMAIASPPPPPTAPASPGWLRREVGGVPVWGVLLGVGAIAGGGYYLFTRAKAMVVNNTDTDDTASSRPRRAREDADDLDANPAAGTARRSTWAPSRTRVADRMQRWLTERNKADGAVVLADADEALAKGVKNPSPLLNLRVKRTAKLHEDAEFAKWARREGLKPVRIDPTTVGLVPAENTKRGEQWESYVDALREEGQKV